MELLVLSAATGGCLGVLRMTKAESAIYDPVTQQKKYIVVGAVYDEELVVPHLSNEERLAYTPQAGAILFDTDEGQVYFGDGVTAGGYRSSLNVNDLPDMNEYALAVHDHDFGWRYAPLEHAEDGSIHVTLADKEFWNNNVFVFNSEYDPETNKAATMADVAAAAGDEFAGVTTSNEFTGNGTAAAPLALAVHLWTGTRAQYDAIGTKDGNTLYFITEA